MRGAAAHREGAEVAIGENIRIDPLKRIPCI
jgi:hypothetical protein